MDIRAGMMDARFATTANYTLLSGDHVQMVNRDILPGLDDGGRLALMQQGQQHRHSRDTD